MRSVEGKAQLREVTDDVLELAVELDEATPERIARIELAYKQNDIDALKAELEDLVRARSIAIRPYYTNTLGSPVRPGQPWAGSTTTNITVNASRTMSPRDINSMLSDWNVVNG